MAGKNEGYRCSFCGKSQNQVHKLIAGNKNTFICDECVELCKEILEEEMDKQGSSRPLAGINLLKPVEIMDHLNQYVIGQDDAKKALAVAVYNHYKRI